MDKVNKHIYEKELRMSDYEPRIVKQPQPQKATKYDSRDKKTRVELTPTSAHFAEAQVLTFGAEKYGAHNWRKGMEWSRLSGAALRHLYAWMSGEDVDPESGLNHLAHARTCIGFLIEYQTKGIGDDDRNK